MKYTSADLRLCIYEMYPPKLTTKVWLWQITNNYNDCLRRCDAVYFVL